MLTYHIWKLCKCDVSGVWNEATHSIVQYSTVQYSTVRYSTVQYSIVQGEEGRGPGTHCLRMRQVPLVTCTLLRYTKIFCLPA